MVSRVFLSHSRRDSRQAIAVKAWLIEQEPGLAEEIYLDLDPHTGIQPGERWKQALQQANARCEAVICLLSEHCDLTVLTPRTPDQNGACDVSIVVAVHQPQQSGCGYRYTRSRLASRPRY